MLNRQQGNVLAISLLISAVFGVFTLLMVQMMQSDARSQATSGQIGRSLAAARGGVNIGFAALQGDLRDELSAAVGLTSSPAGRWAYGISTASLTEPDPVSADNALKVLTAAVQLKADAMTCSQSIKTSNGDVISLRIHLTANACGQTLPPGVKLPPGRFVEGGPRLTAGTNNAQTYAVPFVMVTTGKTSGAKRNIVTQGEYRFLLGRTSYARYALFTHIHKTASNSSVVFTDTTLFNGPVHTNGTFVFAGDAYFGSYVSSAGCTNTTSPPPGTCGTITPGATINYGRNSSIFSSAANFKNNINAVCTNYSVCPQFDKGYDLNSAYVPMPVTNTSLKAEAAAAGIFLAGDAQVHLWTGGTDGTVSNGGAAYQYVATCPTTATSRSSTGCVTYRATENSIQTYTGTASGGVNNPLNWSVARPFNGVIHSDGKITRLAGPTRTNATNPSTAAPAVHRDSNITISASNDVRITTDLRYENQPCSGSLGRNSSGQVQKPDCANTDAKNVLGVYSQSGNVLIGTSWTSTCTQPNTACTVANALDHAPNDVTINAVLMSATKEVAVEKHDVGPRRGTVNLLGGMIEYYYGAVGLVGSSGFGRAFTYDTRMLAGLSPSAFPTTYTDEVKSVFTYSFGDREQP